MRLSKQDRETIIIFNESNDAAGVFTYNRSWMAHLERMGYEPSDVHRVSDGVIYAKDNSITKSLIRKPIYRRRRAPLSQGQLDVLAAGRKKKGKVRL